MPDYIDFKMVVLEQQLKEQARMRARQEEHKAISVAMSELKLSDPRWKVYADQLEGLKQVILKQIKACEDQLTGPCFLDVKEYGQARMNEAYAKGYRDAIIKALGIVEETAGAKNSS